MDPVANFSNVTSEEMEDDRLGKALLILYTAVIILVGGIGNGILIFVHFRRKPDPRGSGKIQVLYHFIFIMAVLDFIVCTMILPIQIYTLLNQYRSFSSLSCKIFAFGRLFAVYASMFILVAIAIDRYISVCFPFAQPFSINMRKARVLTMGAIATAFVAAIPNLYVFEIVEMGSIFMCKPDEENANKAKIADLILLETLSLYIGCALVIIFLYTSVFLSVLRQAVKRRNLRNRSAIPNCSALGSTVEAARDNITARTGMMLFLVTTVFILAWTPYWVMYLVMYNWQSGVAVLMELHLVFLLGCSYYVNNAVNPIIYTFVNKAFRDEIISILQCKEHVNQYTDVKVEPMARTKSEMVHAETEM